MNLDISIPNSVFREASKLAQNFDVSFNELNTAALTAYIAMYGNDDITARLNKIYAEEDSSMDPGFIAAQVAAIGDEV